MKTTALSDLVDIISGATPKTGCAEYWDGDVHWATPADVSKLDGPYISETPRTLTKAGVRSCATRVLPPGTVLLSSRAPIGHVAINTVPMATNQGFKSLVPGSRIDPKFLYHWLKSNTTYLQSLGNGATFKELSKQTTEKIEIPVPPLDEQRRIAAILDHADALRAKRRQVLAHLDTLTQSIFHDMFATVAADATVGEVAEIQGGLQVSSKRAGLPVEAPYLRVANAQRGRLDLSEVKTIRGTHAEIERTTLVAGDLLFVEGHANPLEIGRVALWAGEIAGCVHQNHLIRSRLDPSRALPIFAATWLNSDLGAAHFRRAGRTTSGLNTISASTVRSAPLPLPNLARQHEFARRIRSVNAEHVAVLETLAAADELFSSLQSRAFRGEL